MPGHNNNPTTALRNGLRVSILSICWTVVASSVAITLGVLANSVVLVAFGLTGVLDAVGSISLVVHFRHGLRHESFSDRHEQIALRIVTIGLIVVGISTIAGSIDHLVDRDESHSTLAGLLTAAASMFVLAALSHRKRRIAVSIPSRALLADGGLSATGALLALATVAGTGLRSAFGWWWVDPIAGLLVALGAVLTAVVINLQDIGDTAFSEK